MDYCAYYDIKNLQIVDFWPNNIDVSIKNRIRHIWNQEIPRKILQVLSSEDDVTVPKIKEKIGHSMSTLHENIKKLEDAKLIETNMIYIKNKQKIIKPKILFVTKNPKLKKKLTTFLNKGLWVDSRKTHRIIDLLNSKSDKFFTVEEISIKTKIPVDEVMVLLDNWESQITRAFSDFLKDKPFEKRVLYRAKRKK